MDYEQYVSELAQKYETTPDVIKRAVAAFNGNDDDLFAEIANTMLGDASGSISLRDCIEYTKIIIEEAIPLC